MNASKTTLTMVALAMAGTLAVCGDTPKAAAPVPAKPAPARSAFVIPAGVREGRDPFFPESTRPYEEQIAAKKPMDVNAFVVKGLSIERGHPMVIINNHTFAVGDEGDVLTTNGRMHLRLLEIRGSAAVIEVNGVQRELSLTNK